MSAPHLWPHIVARGCTLLCLVGFVLLVLAHGGAQGEEQLDAQIPWLNLAVAGTLTAAAGQIGLLIVGRQRIAQVRLRVVQAAEQLAVPATPPQHVHMSLVTVAGATTFHRPTCLLVAGKPHRRISNAKRLRGCEVCQP